MPRYAAFLRAVNVGGRTVPMAALVRVFEGLGLEGVRTFIASGNVVFESRAGEAALRPKLELALRNALGFEIPTFLRTAAEVAAIAARAPFDAERRATARSIYVGLLPAPLPPAARRALVALQTPTDEFEANGREVWWLLRTGLSESKLTYAHVERRVGAAMTFRNVNTMVRMTAKFGFA